LKKKKTKEESPPAKSAGPDGYQAINYKKPATPLSPVSSKTATTDQSAAAASTATTTTAEQAEPDANAMNNGAPSAGPQISDLVNPDDGAAAAAVTVTEARTTKGKYTLQDFIIQRTLGTGSFGRVHLVQSKHNQRYYAVKVLKKQQVVKMKQIEHTNDERRMLQRVKHPFCITLWGTFSDARNLYMVMDFIEGGELFSLLRKSQVSQQIDLSKPTLNKCWTNK